MFITSVIYHILYHMVTLSRYCCDREKLAVPFTIFLKTRKCKFVMPLCLVFFQFRSLLCCYCLKEDDFDRPIAYHQVREYSGWCHTKYFKSPNIFYLNLLQNLKFSVLWFHPFVGIKKKHKQGENSVQRCRTRREWECCHSFSMIFCFSNQEVV